MEQTTEQKIQRQIAYIVQVRDVLEGKYVQQQGWTPDYIASSWGEHISRVNVVGTIVDRTERQIILDDGTATIPLRSFEEVHNFAEMKVGDCCICVGKVRKYNDEIYILSEIIRPCSSTFLYARQKHMRLFEEHREIEKAKQHNQALVAIEQAIDEDNSETPLHPILQYIEDNDNGNGVEINTIVQNNGEDAKRQVDLLLMNGDIFEIKPGVVKVLK